MVFTQIMIDLKTKEEIRKRANAEDRPMASFLRLLFRKTKSPTCLFCGAHK